MAKSGKAPKGYYSATQVMRRLGIGSSTLYHFVETGKIKRIVPPNMRDGYYSQDEVDKMARERELFLLTYSKDTSQFSRATEEDIQGIYDVTASLWNSNPSYEERLSRWEKNPYIYYVIKKEGIVAGFIGLTPMKKEALDTLMGETFQRISQNSDNVLPFTEGQPLENVSLDIAIRKGIPHSEPYGLRLIMGAIEAMEDLAKQGNIVEKLYAASSTPDGIKLCRNLGFTELPSPTGASRKRFVLNLETSTSPLLQKYREILKKRKRNEPSTKKNQKTKVL